MAKSGYDLIVIGSGMGALSLASIMARARRWRVLVLERHHAIGGYTHTFKRQRSFQWDVGLHYVGQLGKGEDGRLLFDYITDGALEWNKMPDPFDVFSYPDFSFREREGAANFKTDLIAMFPDENKAISQYFKDIKRAGAWNMTRVMAGVLPGAAGRAAKGVSLADRGFALTTTKEYTERNFKDPKLRALLLSQWGDYGLTPSECPFVMHALVVSHFMDGGYYPAGGSGRIADCVRPIVEDAGGRFITRCDVQEIIVRNGKAAGVKARIKKGKEIEEREFFAPVIASNAGEYNTFTRLLPGEYADRHWSDPRDNGHFMSTACVYIGLKQSPEKLGLRGENYWFYGSYDHDANYWKNDVLNGKPLCAMVTFPSMKDPDAEGHTADVLTFAPYACFKQWEDAPWRKRAPEYYEAKEKMADALLDFVESRMPGFKDLIAFREASTPLTNVHFCGHPQGGIYGMPATPARLRRQPVNARTPVKNLYLTGADAFMCGILPAAMGGVIAAGNIMGPLGFLGVMARMGLDSMKR
jgi:phytoene dehydrogenase-like protein